MKNLPIVLAAALALPVASYASVIVNETFATGERTNLNVPNGLQWYSSAGVANVTYTDNTSLAQATGSSGRHLVGYFTADGFPQTLAQGQTLTVTSSITFNRASALGDGGNNFRIGLFNSDGGARVSVDNHGGTSVSTTFDNYLGYFAGFNLGSSATSTASIRERTSTTNQALIAGVAAYATLGSSASPEQAFSADVAYTFVYSFTRTVDDELSIVMSVNNNSFSILRVDGTPSTFGFDMIAFNMTSNTADGFTINSLNVSVIPEPSAFAALAGLGVLGLAVARRRRV